jgi:orotate phosphoribosyltransferase
LHSKFYFQKFRILENPGVASRLCRIIADHFQKAAADWVIGPTTGGIIIAFEVARQLNILTGFAEERERKRTIGRGFAIKGKRILVVDDVMTTGRSVQETIDAVKEKGGEVVGVGVLIDRCNAKLPFEYFASYRKAVENYEPRVCPMCKAGTPLEKLGGA